MQCAKLRWNRIWITQGVEFNNYFKLETFRNQILNDDRPICVTEIEPVDEIRSCFTVTKMVELL